MTHLLDTDTCIGVLRQRPGMVQRLSQLAPTDCAVSMVTVFELFCGLAEAQDPMKERHKVERFVSTIIELPLDRASAEPPRRFVLNWNGKARPSALTICSSPGRPSP